MKCNDFLKIQLQFPKMMYDQGKQKESVAWDTETRQGIPFLLCSSKDDILTDKTSMIDALLDKQNIKTLNVFYNLGYDASAILKMMLSKRELKFFASYGYVISEHRGENIFYSMLGNKCLTVSYAQEDQEGKYTDLKSIDYKIERKRNYFDVWQFFKYEGSSSLDNVSKKYLKKSKVPIEELTYFEMVPELAGQIKRGRVRNYDKSDLILDHTVIDYCLQDCYLTKELTDLIIKACNEVGIIFNKPYSCASLAWDYLSNVKQVKNPKYFLWQFGGKTLSSRNYSIFYHAYHSYRGGRSEVAKRGYFEHIEEYDVNSMYPWAMTQLEDCFKCDWIPIESNADLLKHDPENIAYGFFILDIDLPYNYVNALPVQDKKNGILIYPYGELKDYFLTHIELKMLMDLGIITEKDFRIKNGWIGLKRSGVFPFRDIVIDLYRERKKYDKDNFLNSLIKILLNSTYGRLIEVNINNVQGDTIDLEAWDEYDITDEELIKKCYIAGKYFNPIYANYITALSRVKLYTAIFHNMDNFIASFTDSVISTKPLKGIDESLELGAWKHTHGDQLTMIGTGFYQLIGYENKDRMRGVHVVKESDNIYDSSFERVLQEGFKVKRVLKLKESLRQDRIEEYNTFEEKWRVIDLNFDTKRTWDYSFTDYASIKQGVCDSKPLFLETLI